ncbi:hypothetical protein ACWGE0_25355 [Lentzea sp. NPDC054927]
MLKEAGEFRSADEVRAAMTGGEQPWKQAALSYLEQGRWIVMSMSCPSDLLDPDGPKVDQRQTFTDGVWLWHGMLIHYLRKYDVALPAEFLEHMAAREWVVPELTDDEVEAICDEHFGPGPQAAPVAQA